MTTLRQLQMQAKKLRFQFPEKDIGISFAKGKPRIQVSP
jgi:hypothetical protein